MSASASNSGSGSGSPSASSKGGRSGRRPKKQDVELAVLALLADGPSYGYAMAREIAARSDGGLSLSPGVLYPMLRRMEQDGLLTTSWETIRSGRPEAEDTDGRRRKWYELSARGRKQLEQRIEAHRAWTRMIDRLIRPTQEEST